MGKKRADLYLVESGLVESRERAKQLIESGNVLAAGRPVEKPSTLVEEGTHLQIETPPPYVSRGGLKLEKALRVFDIDVSGKRAVDLGVGTGGFTDCLLKHGAAGVIAVDVGYGQVAWSIRTDPRVVLLERTNVRELSAADLPWMSDIATVDLSFISVTKILQKIREFVKPQGCAAILVKPQFEAGREAVGKKGIIRDPKVHTAVLRDFISRVATEGFDVRGLTYSPIAGGKGNIEFLLYAGLEAVGTRGDWSANIEGIVSQAHKELAHE
ncbi:MAG: TlyA family RNA methyltransferase [Candidatus Aquicultorales bacterium]